MHYLLQKMLSFQGGDGNSCLFLSKNICHETRTSNNHSQQEAIKSMPPWCFTAHTLIAYYNTKFKKKCTSTIFFPLEKVSHSLHIPCFSADTYVFLKIEIKPYPFHFRVLYSITINLDSQLNGQQTRKVKHSSKAQYSRCGFPYSKLLV